MSEDQEGKKPEEGSFVVKDKRRRGGEEEAESVEPPAEAASGEEPSGQPEQGGEGPGAPPVDFPTFVLSLASSAAYHMGGFQDPVSGKTSVNLDLAKQSIDILAILEEKTKGNLTGDEQKLLTNSLYDLRLNFVEALKNQGR